MLETLASYVLATVLQLPFHLALASPWLLLAVGIAWVTRKTDYPIVRLLWVTLLIAVGIAPAYGFHLSMVPVYTLVMSGLADLPSALVQIGGTWAVILLAVRGYKRYRQTRYGGRRASAEV
jgi:hypothetical protein